MRKIMASTTIAIAAALGTAPTVAAVTVATVYHGVQATSSSDAPNLYYHA